MKQKFIVQAIWDEDAGVWSASSEDISGLAIEADSIESLAAKAGDAIVDLLEMNQDYPEITSFNVEVRSLAPERVLAHAS